MILLVESTNIAYMRRRLRQLVSQSEFTVFAVTERPHVGRAVIRARELVARAASLLPEPRRGDLLRLTGGPAHAACRS